MLIVLPGNVFNYSFSQILKLVEPYGERKKKINKKQKSVKKSFGEKNYKLFFLHAAIKIKFFLIKIFSDFVGHAVIGISKILDSF